MIARRSAVLVATVTLAVALSACTPAAAPTPTPSPTGFASKEEAFAAAEATYRAYIGALNNVDLSDPATFEPLFSLTAGDLNDLDKKSFSRLHAAGSVVTGSTEVVSITPIDASDDEVRLSVCLDVSEVGLTDSQGNSLVEKDRPDLRAEIATVEREPSGKLKLVGIGDGPEGNQCVG